MIVFDWELCVLEGPYLHAYFFMMCTLHQNILFYIIFSFMCFKQCFLKVCTIFSWFEVRYIFPLNTWKQQDLGFVFKEEKLPRSNKKKSVKIPFYSYFFLQDLLFWQKAFIEKSAILDTVCTYVSYKVRMSFLKSHNTNI